MEWLECADLSRYLPVRTVRKVSKLCAETSLGSYNHDLTQRIFPWTIKCLFYYPWYILSSVSHRNNTIAPWHEIFWVLLKYIHVSLWKKYSSNADLIIFCWIKIGLGMDNEWLLFLVVVFRSIRTDYSMFFDNSMWRYFTLIHIFDIFIEQIVFLT